MSTSILRFAPGTIQGRRKAAEHPRRATFIGIACLCLALLPFTVQAATFCVTTPAQLQTALAQAEDNGQHDFIRVTRGTYALTEPLSYRNRDGLDLILEGGHLPGQNCAVQIIEPSYTVIDGGGNTALANIMTGQDPDTVHSGHITIRNLTWRNGVAHTPTTGSASPLAFGSYYRWNGKLTVEWNHFLDIRFDSGSALPNAITMYGDAGGIEVRNNLFAGNSTSNENASSIRLEAYGSDGAPNLFVNNTVFHPPGSNVNAILFFSSPKASWLVANNIVWNATGNAMMYSAAHNVFLWNNVLGARSGLDPVEDVDNYHIAPQFMSASTGDFRLRPDSPLVDLGFTDVPGGVGIADAAGKPRVRGGVVDIGAFEEESSVFRNGFE